MDERNLGKAMATALYSKKSSSRRTIKIKENKEENATKNEHNFSADYLNRRLAEEQKAAWSGTSSRQKTVDESKRDEKATGNNRSSTEKSEIKGETVLKGEIEQEPILPKVIVYTANTVSPIKVLSCCKNETRAFSFMNDPRCLPYSLGSI